MSYRDLQKDAPWPIPMTAQQTIDERQGYQQVSFHWQANGWLYTARWHQPLPTATLITYPSWQLSRIYPGKGFGPDAHHRQEESRVGDQWLPTSQVRYCARCLQDRTATSEQVNILKQAHIPSRFPGK